MSNNFLRFEAGTIVLDLENAEDFPLELIGTFKHDPRSGNFRARACDYAHTVRTLQKSRCLKGGGSRPTAASVLSASAMFRRSAAVQLSFPLMLRKIGHCG